MKREVRQFEYRCDGTTRAGAKCVGVETVTAYDSFDADYRVHTIGDTVTGLTWSFTCLGWLCPEPHRDDPRLRHN